MSSFKITLDDARFWKNCIDSVSSLITEGVFEISPEGIKLRAMDPSQIAMVVFNVGKEAFVEYAADGVSNIGLNLEDLSKILARTRGKEKLVMELDENNKFVIEFISDTKRKFRIPILDIDSNAPLESKVEKIEFDVSMGFSAANLKEILKDVSLISTNLAFNAADNVVVVEAHGDSGDIKEELKKENLNTFTIKQPAKSVFSLKYLIDITNPCPSESIVNISMKTNAPMKLEYAINEAKLVYYLAPRIESV